MRNTLKRRLAAAGAVVVVALAGAGSAFACDGSHAGQGVLAAKFAQSHEGLHHGGLLALPSAYLGLSSDSIKAQLASGKTLAQIAGATPGKSAAGLVDYVVAAAKTKLDAWVAAGKLTQDRETAWLAKLRDKVTALVNGTFTMHDRSGWHQH
jgi:hypothetical protein